MVYISDSHKYNLQLSSIRILAVVRPSWLCRFERAFSGHFRLHFLGFALQWKRYKSEENRIIRDKQMFVVRLRSFFGNLIEIWFFYKIFNSLPSELLFKCQKKWPSLKENIAKDTLVGILKQHPGQRTMFHLQENAIKFLGSLKDKIIEEEVLTVLLSTNTAFVISITWK